MSVIRSVSLLWLGSVVGATMAFLSQIVLARSLGPITYGEFSAALALITTLSPLAAFGAPAFLLRAFVTEGVNGKGWAQPALQFSYLSTLVVTILAVAWAFYAPHSQTSRLLILVLAIHIPSQAGLELLLFKYQLEDKYAAIGLMQGVPHLFRMLLISITALLIHHTAVDEPYLYAVAFVFPSTFVLALSLRAVLPLASPSFNPLATSEGSRHVPTSDKPSRLPTKWNAFVLSIPFGAGTLLHLLYFQSGIIFLGYFSESTDTANFSILIYILSAIYLLPSVLFQRYSQKHYHIEACRRPELFRKTVLRTTISSALAGVAIAIALILGGPILIPLVFGPAYDLAGEISVIMAFAIPLRMASLCLGTALQTRTYVTTKVWCMAFVAGATILLLTILTPSHGIYGAVIATIFSEILLVALYAFFSLKYFPVKHVR